MRVGVHTAPYPRYSGALNAVLTVPESVSIFYALQNRGDGYRYLKFESTFTPTKQHYVSRRRLPLAAGRQWQLQGAQASTRGLYLPPGGQGGEAQETTPGAAGRQGGRAPQAGEGRERVGFGCGPWSRRWAV